MSSLTPQRRTQSSPQQSTGAGPARGQAFRAWLRFLRPSVLTCFGLALTITLWGFNYRLSLYHRHRDTDTASRALAAKFWLDHRNVVVAAAEKPQSVPPVQYVAPAIQPVVPDHAILAIVAPPELRHTLHSRSLLPLRSPPAVAFVA